MDGCLHAVCDGWPLSLLAGPPHSIPIATVGLPDCMQAHCGFGASGITKIVLREGQHEPGTTHERSEDADGGAAHGQSSRPNGGGGVSASGAVLAPRPVEHVAAELWDIAELCRSSGHVDVTLQAFVPSISQVRGSDDL